MHRMSWNVLQQVPLYKLKRETHKLILQLHVDKLEGTLNGISKCEVPKPKLKTTIQHEKNGKSRTQLNPRRVGTRMHTDAETRACQRAQDANAWKRRTAARKVFEA